MQAVGKLGGYISRSVNTVSGPFHPFGGAVDIIVVEQPDASYKSSPWYVRFGKFQGVLKAKEKVVTVSVNGVEADFNMYLDHKGEAFFLNVADVEKGEPACSPRSASCEDADGQSGNRWPVKSDSFNDNSNLSDSIGNERNANFAAVKRTNSCRSQILALVFGRRSRKEEGILEEENASNIVRTDSLQRAEIAADLLELKWSTNLASSRLKKDKAPHFAKSDFHVTSMSMASDVAKSDFKIQYCVEKLNGLSDTSFSGVENPRDTIQSFQYSKTGESSGVGLVQSTEPKNSPIYCCGCGEACVQTETALNMSLKTETERNMIHAWEPLNVGNCLRKEDRFSLIHEEEVPITGETTYGTSESGVTECCSELVYLHQSNNSLKDVDTQSVATISVSEDPTSSTIVEQIVPSYVRASRISREEKFLCGNLVDFGSTNVKVEDIGHADHEGNEADSSFLSVVADEVNESSEAKCCPVLSLDRSVIDDYINDANPPRRKSRSVSSDACINKTGHVQSEELMRMVRSLPNMEPLSNLIASDLGHSSNPSLYPSVKSDATNNHQSHGAQTMVKNVKIRNNSCKGPANPSIENQPRSFDSLRASRRGWPFSFKRSRNMRASHTDTEGNVNPSDVKILNNSCELEGVKDAAKVKVYKKIVKTLTPTSEQLASLNLKEGKNEVIFTFSTAMLGKQQVEARIFLWKWDAQLVISDVDGTITRSDLLGQVMPWVGMDWSQTGVANLFSAIKGNGYQLLFLSARSISQSFHTRKFLLNIKQDGKALPDGPVVTSPTGLFPSLYREVVRRAPHEFKIACLEDIKALFPPDTNPFYAGFGNRDTDEISYLKVGIPRGKIFTINPKGEIVVNCHVDTKSYFSLHALVDSMFPMSSSEQEDFNSWNYWKFPPPAIDL